MCNTTLTLKMSQLCRKPSENYCHISGMTGGKIARYLVIYVALNQVYSRGEFDYIPSLTMSLTFRYRASSI